MAAAESVAGFTQGAHSIVGVEAAVWLVAAAASVGSITRGVHSSADVVLGRRWVEGRHKPAWPRCSPELTRPRWRRRGPTGATCVIPMVSCLCWLFVL